MWWIEALATVFAAFGVSLGLNRVMISVGARLGLMDEPGERRVHTTAVPRAGGIAIWLSFVGVLSVGMGAGWLSAGGGLNWQWLGAFVLGSGILMVAGVMDDREGLPPLVKLGAHVAAPAVFFLIHPVNTGLFPDGWWWGYDFMVFVVWAVVLINAFNLIDGLDGLCGGLAAVSVVAMAALAVVNDRFDAALVLMAMAGALGGFLCFNVNPARIFLGDAGSMLMGFFLATAATEGVGRKTVLGLILLPIAIAGVPLLDVLLAVWRRWMRRWVSRMGGDEASKGIFEADKDHLHHRMLDGNGSQRKVAIVLQALAAVLAVLCLLPLFFGDRMLRVSVVGLLVMGLVALRHLAWVELVHTGQVVHMAIKLPVRKRRMAMLMFAYDLVMLLVAAWLAMMVESNMATTGRDWDQNGRLLFFSVFVMSGMVCLLSSRIHQRLWVRATTRDLMALQFWMVVCGVATFTLMSFGRASLEWSALRMTLFACVFAGIAVGWPRVGLDLVRDLAMGARLGGKGREDEGGYGAVAILGAGDLGTLLLVHLKMSGEHDFAGMRIMGFLDDNRALHGRRLRSFTVLGGLDKVPWLVKHKGLRGIVVAINTPDEEMVERLRQFQKTLGIEVYWWRVGLDHGNEPA